MSSRMESLDYQTIIQNPRNSRKNAFDMLDKPIYVIKDGKFGLSDNQTIIQNPRNLRKNAFDMLDRLNRIRDHRIPRRTAISKQISSENGFLREIFNLSYHHRLHWSGI